MKKVLSIFIMLCCVISLCSVTGCAAETDAAEDAISIVLQINNPMMTVNGAEKEIDPGRGTVPVIINDRTLMPVRAVVEEMGGTVAWDEATQTATLTYGEDEIRLTLGSTTAYLNNEAQTLDVAPVSINDRTMLPIRFISESFRFDLEWDQAQQSVTITRTAQANAQQPAPSAVPSEEQPSEGSSGALVVYFSATGNTEALAEKIAAAAGTDIYEIVPAEPYTSEDLNYNDDSCRANQEMNDETARPAISGGIENIADYDTIFLGYPIWWGTMPRIINTFLDTYDLSGKTIMPFCTSGSSGISSSVSAIRGICTDSNVTEGFRGTASTTEEEIADWLDSSNYVQSAPDSADTGTEQRIRLSWDTNEVVIVMEENATTADFLSRLPMTATFSDYNNTEKISYLEEALTEDTAAAGCQPQAGTMTLYAPWGNLAIFYEDWSYSDDLIPMGRIESGLESLASMEGDFTVTIESLSD